MIKGRNVIAMKFGHRAEQILFTLDVFGHKKSNF